MGDDRPALECPHCGRSWQISDETLDDMLAELRAWDRDFDGERSIFQNLISHLLEGSRDHLKATQGVEKIDGWGPLAVQAGLIRTISEEQLLGIALSPQLSRAELVRAMLAIDLPPDAPFPMPADGEPMDLRGASDAGNDIRTGMQTCSRDPTEEEAAELENDAAGRRMLYGWRLSRARVRLIRAIGLMSAK